MACTLAGSVSAEPGGGRGTSRSQGPVQVKVKADGTKVIFNESTAHRNRRRSSRLESPGADLTHWIELYARRNNLNPRLVQAVIQVESGFNSKALSSKGAMGLMQLMPATARELGVKKPYDVEENIRGGTRYLRQQLDRFSNLSLALAAYNAGPTAVSRHGGIPPYRETRNYVRKVLSLLGLGGSSRPAARLADTRAGGTRTVEPRAGDATKTQPDRPAVKTSAPAKSVPGRKVYLSRGEGNRIFVTTAPPKKSG